MTGLENIDTKTGFLNSFCNISFDNFNRGVSTFQLATTVPSPPGSSSGQLLQSVSAVCMEQALLPLPPLLQAQRHQLLLQKAPKLIIFCP